MTDKIFLAPAVMFVSWLSPSLYEDELKFKYLTLNVGVSCCLLGIWILAESTEAFLVPGREPVDAGTYPKQQRDPVKDASNDLLQSPAQWRSTQFHNLKNENHLN